jgi:hypothetical protein
MSFFNPTLVSAEVANPLPLFCQLITAYLAPPRSTLQYGELVLHLEIIYGPGGYSSKGFGSMGIPLDIILALLAAVDPILLAAASALRAEPKGER